MILLLGLSLLLTHFLSSSCEHVIHIDSRNGHNDPSCIKSEENSCQTLGYVASQLDKFCYKSFIKITIGQPGINLSEAISFDSFKFLSLVGEGTPSPIKVNCNGTNSGLLFVNVSNLSLSNLNITGCGMARNITKGYFIFIELSAMSLVNCSNITIVDCHIFKSNGTGISILDTNGTVHIEKVHVIESTVRAEQNIGKVYGGNGLAVDFTSHLSNFKNKTDCMDHHCSGIMYKINNCTFSKNNASAGEDITTNISHTWINLGCIGSGGGLCVSLGPNSTNVSVYIETCKIVNNTAILYGGGVKVQALDTSHDNHLSLVSSNFTSNRALNEKMGGGLELILAYSTKDDSPAQSFVQNTIFIAHCRFTNNSATCGGGVNIISGEVTMDDKESSIKFVNCTWSENTATLYGTAVHIMPGVWPSKIQGHHPFISFANCTFSWNKVVPNISHFQYYHTQDNGAGAFLSNVLRVLFCGTTLFKNNNGTALFLSGTVAFFCPGSIVLFNSNNGTNGGAVALIGQSFLYVDEASTFNFTQNRASNLGGAIYFQSTESKVYQTCFIYRGLNFNKSDFYFVGNKAESKRGNDIFVSSFATCDIFCPESIPQPYKCIGNFYFTPNNNSIATMPTKFTVDTNHTITLFPGLPAELPLLAMDTEENNVSNLSYQATLVHTESSTMKVEAAYRYVSANNISVVGKEMESATLQLDQLSSGVSILMDITLDKCPPGYILNTQNRCECYTSNYYGLWNCNPVYLIYGVWIGRLNSSNDSAYYTSRCPTGFCSYHNTSKESMALPLRITDLELQEKICSPTRTGIRCGDCKHGHSVYYNSPDFECGPEDHCNFGALYYTLSTVLPLAVLLVMIMLIDANFASGWNSFMLFAQLLSTLYITGYGFNEYQLQALKWLMFVYNFFNLELFNIDMLSFCIWKGANVMDILMVKLGSTCIALALVISIVLFLMQPKVVKLLPFLNRRRYSVVNGISAFLILCYAQCAKTCFQVLYTSCLFDKDGCWKEVVFYSSDVIPFHGIHIKYATVAVIFLTLIVVIPPTLFLFYPLFFKVLGCVNLSESKLAKYLWILMPIQLLDSLQNPFKDEYRFFSGLYFLYRIVPLIIYTFTKKWILFYPLTELCVILMIVLHAAFQPYKKRLHNFLDLVLLFNLSLVNGITLFSFTTIMIGHKDGVILLNTTQLVLLLLPLTGAALFLIVKSLIWLKKTYMPTNPSYTSLNPLSFSYGPRED